MSRKLSFNKKKSQGFTLLEAIIGFLILTIGMLGIGSLQGLSLKAGKTAVYGSVAAMKIDELFESMRTNPGALASYTGGGGANGCTGTAAICTAEEIAADEAFLWQQSLTAGLPAGTSSEVVIVNAPVAPSMLATVRVSISWQERSETADGDPEDKTYSLTADICTGNPC